MERFEADPDPLETKGELALARALIHDWLDRYGSAAGCIDPEASQKGPRLQDLAPLLDGISKVVKRIQDARLVDALPRKDLLRVMTEMANVVNLHVDDPEVRSRIAHDWARLRLA